MNKYEDMVEANRRQGEWAQKCNENARQRAIENGLRYPIGGYHGQKLGLDPEDFSPGLKKLLEVTE